MFSADILKKKPGMKPVDKTGGHEVIDTDEHVTSNMLQRKSTERACALVDSRALKCMEFINPSYPVSSLAHSQNVPLQNEKEHFKLEQIS